MPSHTAFFYGTLMAPPILHRVIWGSARNVSDVQKAQLHVRPAILHGFQRRKVRYADYPAIIPADKSTTVRGTLVSGLTDGDIWRLDIFEGTDYKREKVKVRVLAQGGKGNEGMGDLSQREEDNVEGDEIEAEVYVWISGEEPLESQEWDFAEFVKEKMSRWAGVSAAAADQGFQDVDDAVAASQEDPTGGRGANGDITRALEESR
ncbi:hypothetical protein BU24DRAFT_416906 [Aaosphaeria arxii CBS 175.79]|uniref:Putative gamma-glutamylcyclotransferase n=1 Tax=Aaosphaeria arxii CBS 175.79 TaxID=1450172 RepID=A0A6A5Y6T9_9PLEO|nr:uncharacterized protein BU24DRAFT_416906 [Aaosphaeria arxii CBS 175.79]KAF2021248.1 hypothetical protein BU24DRAFT_416906 [Aaosphaeria arxii CBS 175.79]